jgi:hypothetical protein
VTSVTKFPESGTMAIQPAGSPRRMNQTSRGASWEAGEEHLTSYQEIGLRVAAKWRMVHCECPVFFRTKMMKFGTRSFYLFPSSVLVILGETRNQFRAWARSFNSSSQFTTTCISLGPVCVSLSLIRMNPFPSGVTAISCPLSKYGPSNNSRG